MSSLTEQQQLEVKAFFINLWEVHRKVREGEMNETDYMPHAHNLLLDGVAFLKPAEMYSLLGTLAVILKKKQDGVKPL